MLQMQCACRDGKIHTCTVVHAVSWIRPFGPTVLYTTEYAVLLMYEGRLSFAVSSTRSMLPKQRRMESERFPVLMRIIDVRDLRDFDFPEGFSMGKEEFFLARRFVRGDK